MMFNLEEKVHSKKKSVRKEAVKFKWNSIHSFSTKFWIQNASNFGFRVNSQALN